MPTDHLLLTQGEVVDVRVYDQADAGEWQPTKKGLTVTLDLRPAFQAAIAQVAIEDTPPQRPARPLQRRKRHAG